MIPRFILMLPFISIELESYTQCGLGPSGDINFPTIVSPDIYCSFTTYHYHWLQYNWQWYLNLAITCSVDNAITQITYGFSYKQIFKKSFLEIIWDWFFTVTPNFIVKPCRNIKLVNLIFLNFLRFALFNIKSKHWVVFSGSWIVMVCIHIHISYATANITVNKIGIQ